MKEMLPFTDQNLKSGTKDRFERVVAIWGKLGQIS